jgi:hypothetical protein
MWFLELNLSKSWQSFSNFFETRLRPTKATMLDVKLTVAITDPM